MAPPRTSKRLLSLAAVSALGLTVLGATPASAANVTVSNVTELRAAVAEANARPGADAIRLTDNISFARSTGDIEVTDRLVIEGRNLTINAAGVDRAFTVTDTRLTVRNMTIRGGAPAAGESGGALLNDGGNLTVNNVRAVNNVVTGTGASGGAIASVNGGRLNVVDSTLSRNSATRAGGAIEANGGATTVTGTTMSRNSTGAGPGNGGALHLTGAGTVDVSDSIVTNNRAAAEGGGLWNSGAGTMTVSDTKVSGNTVAGAGADQGGGGLFQEAGATGNLTVTGGTITDNTATGAAGSGGGILNDQGTVAVSGTTIARNTSVRAGGGIEANIGSTTLNAWPLSKNATGPTPGNGGGLHLTGAGTVDVVGGKVVNNTATAEGGGLWNSGSGTFSIDGTRIAGNSAAGNDATQGGGGVFNDGGNLTITDATITTNSATGTAGSGGGILNDRGTLTVTTSAVSNNSAVRAGGGIEANIGSTTVDRSSLNKNTTGSGPGNGGGLHLTGAGDVKVLGSTVRGNTATAEGGGLWNSATGTFLVDSTTVSANIAKGNDADQGGGGIFNDGGALTVTGSKVLDNTASGTSGSGGGIISLAGSLSVSDTALSGNVARRAGGGIEVANGAAALSGVTLRDNVTSRNPGNGGGMHVGGTGNVTYDGGTVTGNIATNEGGGLWNGATATLTVTGVAIRSNTAPIGANVYTQPGGVFTVDGAAVPAGQNNL